MSNRKVCQTGKYVKQESMLNRKVCHTGKYVKQESKKYSSPSRMLSYFPDIIR